MRFAIGAIVCAALSFHHARPSSAGVLTEGADKDNSLIYSATGNLSDGAGESFFTGLTQQTFPDSQRRGLIEFGVSAIPAGSIINSVTLTLSLDRTTDGVSRAVTLHRVLQNWGQGASNAGGVGNGGGGGAGAPAAQNDATWLYTFYNASNPTASPTWNTPGGDFLAAESASTMTIGPIFNTAVPYTWSGPGMVADVQYWLDHPGTDFGWAVLTDGSIGGTARRFDTSENSIVADRPILQVDFTPPSTVPEPSSMLLFSASAAAMAWLARRRRSEPC